MSPRNTGPALAAGLAAGAMIAAQVGGKATRDAFYLSHFPVTTLPTMVMVAAALSIALVFLTSRWMTRVGPGRLVPAGFVVSGGLHLAEWGLARSHAPAASVLVYLHTAALGLLLVSSFWALVTERFDPRTARVRISRIGAGAALGGVLGGLAAMGVGPAWGVNAMLPVLAALHVVAAGAAWFLARGGPSSLKQAATEDDEAASSPLFGVRVLTDIPYLRHLALLVLTGTMAAAFLDYVFKAEATAAYANGAGLIRFFALFYTGTSALTFLLQSVLAKRLLERQGLSRTVACLPVAVAGGSLAALAVPGLAGVATARGGETVLRSSLFRSAYELHYTPIRERDKRATKSIIDVGVERLGDVTGAGLVSLVLLLSAGSVRPVLLVAAAALGVAGLLVTRQLSRGYIAALEASLLHRAVDLDPDAVADRTTRTTMLRTLTRIPRPAPSAAPASTETELAPVPAPVDLADPVLAGAAVLRSGDASRIRALLDGGRLERSLAPLLADLLARDDLSESVVRALVRMGPRVTGQVADALLDPDRDFAVRRRAPRVLAEYAVPRSAAALAEGLEDARFEVRFQCGRALSRLREAGVAVPVPDSVILERVREETAVDRRVWEGRRLLERDTSRESVFVDEVLRDRANRSLEHVFTLLSLVFPREPLKIAFRGLHTRDAALRGTALEYLESILPADVHDALWPLLEGAERAPRPPRTREAALDELLKSSRSIQIDLGSLRQPEPD